MLQFCTNYLSKQHKKEEKSVAWCGCNVSFSHFLENNNVRAHFMIKCPILLKEEVCLKEEWRSERKKESSKFFLVCCKLHQPVWYLLRWTDNECDVSFAPKQSANLWLNQCECEYFYFANVSLAVKPTSVIYISILNISLINWNN